MPALPSPFAIPLISRTLAESPLCVVDVGAAGGIDPAWHRFEYHDHLRFFGFEANPDEFAKLKSDRQTTYFSMAVSEQTGILDFYAGGTSGALSRRTDREAIHNQIFQKIQVESDRLDNLRRNGTLPAIDALKIDIEGHDYTALISAGDYLEGEILYIKSEFSFFRSPSPGNFSDIDALLTSKGFLLFGLSYNYGACGEISGGDVLYLRSVESILVDNTDNALKRERILKLLVICFYTRKVEYAYMVARRAHEAAVLSEREFHEVEALIMKWVFLPGILPRFKRLFMFAYPFFMLAQLCAGKRWGSKSLPKDNRLERYAPLFIRPRFPFNGLINRINRRQLEERYRRYTIWRPTIYD